MVDRFARGERLTAAKLNATLDANRIAYSIVEFAEDHAEELDGATLTSDARKVIQAAWQYSADNAVPVYLPAGDTAGWVSDVLVERPGAASGTNVIGGGGASIAPTYSDAAAAGWRIAIVADTTNGGLAIKATGEANKNINWVARVMTVDTVG